MIVIPTGTYKRLLDLALKHDVILPILFIGEQGVQFFEEDFDAIANAFERIDKPDVVVVLEQLNYFKNRGGRDSGLKSQSFLPLR